MCFETLLLKKNKAIDTGAKSYKGHLKTLISECISASKWETALQFLTTISIQLKYLLLKYLETHWKTRKHEAQLLIRSRISTLHRRAAQRVEK